MNFIKHYPLSILTTLVVIGLSLFPIGPMEMVEGVPFIDKWTHMVMYAGLTAVIVFEKGRLLKSQLSTSNSQFSIFNSQFSIFNSQLSSLLYSVALGGLMELMQAYCTTYRSGEWLDFLADSLGALIGFLIGCLLNVVLKKL